MLSYPFHAQSTVGVFQILLTPHMHLAKKGGATRDYYVLCPWKQLKIHSWFFRCHSLLHNRPGEGFQGNSAHFEAHSSGENWTRPLPFNDDVLAVFSFSIHYCFPLMVFFFLSLFSFQSSQWISPPSVRDDFVLHFGLPQEKWTLNYPVIVNYAWLLLLICYFAG